MKRLLFLLFFIQSIIAGPTPIVLWHGMGDTCCNTISLGGFKYFLQQQIPGVYVNSLRIGDSTIEDLENGYFMSPNKQVDYVCEKLSKDTNLIGGFNAIGFSQGAQFLRAVVQKCGHTLPPIKNLISLGGQHQGVYGLPNCVAMTHKSCDYVRELLNYAAYANWVQDALVQATYWHDPLEEELYRTSSHFLADINNELAVNQTYIDNLNRLHNFVLVKYNNDTIVQPRETEWFGYYVPGQSEKVYTLQDSPLYIEDRLGLKKMEKAGKLKFLATNGNHLRMTDTWFKAKIMKPFLIDDDVTTTVGTEQHTTVAYP